MHTLTYFLNLQNYLLSNQLGSINMKNLQIFKNIYICKFFIYIYTDNKMSKKMYLIY